MLASVLRTSLTMLVLASGTLVAGCGSSHSGNVGSSKTTATQSTSTRTTKAQAVAYAHVINLHAGDVPAMTATGPPEGETAKEQRSVAELARCAGGVGSEHQLVDIRSSKFSRGSGLQQEQVGSGVSVLSSAALASRELTAVRSARGRACITHFARKQFTEKGTEQLHYDQITTSPLPVPSTAGESFGLRVTVTLTAPHTGTHFSFYLDFLGFVSGPAEIDLNALSISKPVPSATERRLLSLLHSRAEAHKL